MFPWRFLSTFLSLQKRFKIPNNFLSLETRFDALKRRWKEVYWISSHPLVGLSLTRGMKLKVLPPNCDLGRVTLWVAWLIRSKPGSGNSREWHFSFYNMSNVWLNFTWQSVGNIVRLMSDVEEPQYQSRLQSNKMAAAGWVGFGSATRLQQAMMSPTSVSYFILYFKTDLLVIRTEKIMIYTDGDKERFSREKFAENLVEVIGQVT